MTENLEFSINSVINKADTSIEYELVLYFCYDKRQVEAESQ